MGGCLPRKREQGSPNMGVTTLCLYVKFTNFEEVRSKVILFEVSQAKSYIALLRKTANHLIPEITYSRPSQSKCKRCCVFGIPKEYRA
jgi:hypothetical protein